MPHIEVRPARAEDREAVLAFCARTWEWGDYIEHVWDRWLTDPQGRLFVAVSGEQPVGVIHMQMLTETDAWLEGIRVDPAYRQQGIADALHDAATAEALRRGATNVRLITASTNIPSIRLSEKHHMHQVGAFVPYVAQALPGAPRRDYGLQEPVLATAEDLEEIIEYLNVSNIFPTTGGLYYQGYTAYRITDRLLNAKIEAGQVYLLRRWERLDGLAIAEPRAMHSSKHLFIGYIDGTTESISLLAYELRRTAASMGLERVRAHIPDLIMVRDAFSGAEYEADDEPELTFERSLV